MLASSDASFWLGTWERQEGGWLIEIAGPRKGDVSGRPKEVSAQDFGPLYAPRGQGAGFAPRIIQAGSQAKER